MKKILIAIAAFVFLGGISLVGCLVLASRMTGDAHQEFFDQVAVGDADAMLSKFTPELRKEIDAPVLAAWLDQFNNELGGFTKTTNFNYNIQNTNGVSTTLVAGTAHFEKGKAEVELKYIGDQINGFQINTPALEGEWFAGPKNTTLYQDRAKAFLEAFAGGRVTDAYRMMHEALKKEVDAEAAAKMSESVVAMIGKLKEVKITGTEFSKEDGDELTVSATVIGESKEVQATVDFQFVGLKGHLLAFNFAAPSVNTADETAASDE